MLRIVKTGIFCIVLALIFVSALRAQQPKKTPPAPVPAQISAAKTVFISNAGADLNALQAMKRAGDREQAYDQFYWAMKSWGRYRLASTPAEADLVFEIRFIAPMIPNGSGVNYQPQFLLTILDAKTHFPLWAFVEPVQGAFRKATWDKNVDEGLTKLMNDVKRLSGQAVSMAKGARK